MADSTLRDSTPHAAPARQAQGIRGLPEAPVLFLGAAVAGAGTYLLILQSHFTFFADDWNFILDRRGFNIDVFLDPHNDHIALAPVAIYKALLAVFGLGSLLPFAFTSTLVFLLSVVLLFVYVRRCVGDWLALLGCVLVLFLGAGWSDLLWSFQIGFSGSIAAGIGALLALDRNDRGGDLAACALLVLATAFSELGISFALGGLVSVALGPPPRLRRLYIPLLPVALYGLWYLGWGHTAPSTASFDNFVDSPQFVFESISENIASLLGIVPLSSDVRDIDLGGLGWGEILLVIGVGLAVWRVWQSGGPTHRLWTVLAAGGSFWFLTAINANLLLRTSTTGRYQYPGAVFVLLIAAELLRGIRVDRRTLIPAAAVTAAAAVSGIVFLHDAYDFRRETSDNLRARLAAVEIGRGAEQPNAGVAFHLFLRSTVAKYLSAVDEFGSPAFSQSQLLARDQMDRGAADRQLVVTEGIALTAVGAGPAAASRTAGGCRAVNGSASAQTVSLGPGRYTLSLGKLEGITGPVPLPISAARFADQPSIELGAVSAPGAATLNIPADRSSIPWRLYWPQGSSGMVCGFSQ
jgi:hypothetical protein